MLDKRLTDVCLFARSILMVRWKALPHDKLSEGGRKDYWYLLLRGRATLHTRAG